MSISLNGVNQWLDLGAPGELNDQTRATFVAWIRPRNEAASSILGDDVVLSAFSLRYGGAAGVLAVLIYNPGTAQFHLWQRLNTPGIAVGAWASVVVAVDLTQPAEAQRLRVYVNGADVTDGGVFTGLGYPATFAPSAGARSLGRQGAAYFNGCLGQVAIYVGSARSGAEAAQIHALGITGPLEEVAAPRHWYKLDATFEDSGTTPVAAVPNGGVGFGCPEGEPAAPEPEPDPEIVADVPAAPGRAFARASVYVTSSGVASRRDRVAVVQREALGVYRIETAPARSGPEHVARATPVAPFARLPVVEPLEAGVWRVRIFDAHGAPADSNFSFRVS